MNKKFNLLGQEISYSIQEGKIIGDEFFIRIAIQSWESREVESWMRDTQATKTICVPETEYVWVKVSKEKFEEITECVVSEQNEKLEETEVSDE